jgi:predicted dehydrogenase
MREIRTKKLNVAQVVKGNVRLIQPVTKGGGPVYDMGIYRTNAARYLFGAEPTEVCATSASRGEPHFRNAEETTSVVLRFPQERLATLLQVLRPQTSGVIRWSEPKAH